MPRRRKVMKYWMMWIMVLVIMCVMASAVPAEAEGFDLGTEELVVPYRYVYLSNNRVPIYAAPGDPAQMSPVRSGGSGSVWMSIKEEVQAEDGRVWYRVNEEEYLAANDVLVASPSSFRGITVGQTDPPPVGFVVATNLNVRARPGTSPDNPPLTTLPRYSVVTVLGHAASDEDVWYRIGPSQYVHGRYVRVVRATPRPAGVSADDKWTAVDLSQQTLAAYEGDRMVLATLVSTGLPGRRTPEGLFRIWVKLQSGKMSGGSPELGDYYYLQDVPWTMYYHGNYGLHAAYWHDGFGDPRSRGCVNLSPRDARWLFDWVTPSMPEGRRAAFSTEENLGTWVYVFSSTTADSAPSLT
jgi:lipoprotein-anchoring transpeptidase ErfK/SrfK